MPRTSQDCYNCNHTYTDHNSRDGCTLNDCNCTRFSYGLVDDVEESTPPVRDRLTDNYLYMLDEQLRPLERVLTTYPTDAPIPETPPTPSSVIPPHYSGYNPQRKFGVEIECVGLTRHSRNRIEDVGVQIVGDGSINAHPLIPHGAGEIRLGPWRGNSGLRKVKEICDILKEEKISVNRSCGLHVHHDLTQYYSNYDAYMQPNSGLLTPEEICQRLRFVYQRYSPAIELFFRPSRWRNEYCESFVGLGNLSLRNPHGRYLSINGPTHHSTVEFRQHQGTVSYKRIRNWIILTNMLLEYAIYTFNIPLRVTQSSAPLKEMWGKLILSDDEYGKSAKEHYKREMRSLAKSRGSVIPRFTFTPDMLNGCKVPARAQLRSSI